MNPDTIDINIDLPGGRMPASHEAASAGPLDGIRVLDLSSVVMGRPGRAAAGRGRLRRVRH
jgi:hypothetical protein